MADQVTTSLAEAKVLVMQGLKGDPGYSPQIEVLDITGGHQVRVTYKDDQTHIQTDEFNVMDGAPGQPGTPGVPGTPGADGFSPTVEVQDITQSLPGGGTEVIGHKVIITDANGPHIFNVMDGEDGEGGGGGAAEAVLYIAQSLTAAQKAQARTNIDAGTYSKPSGGIPKTDLASDVQTSLGKADSAYQKPSGGIPASDLAVGVIPDISGKVDKVTGYGLVSSRDVTNGYELAINENGTVSNLPVVAISSYNTAMQQASQALAAKADASSVYTKTEIDSKGYQTAAQVQTAIAQLQPKSINDTGGYFTTDTVDGALQEIGAELAGINTLIGSGVIS